MKALQNEDDDEGNFGKKVATPSQEEEKIPTEIPTEVIKNVEEEKEEEEAIPQVSSTKKRGRQTKNLTPKVSKKEKSSSEEEEKDEKEEEKAESEDEGVKTLVFLLHIPIFS